MVDNPSLSHIFAFAMTRDWLQFEIFVNPAPTLTSSQVSQSFLSAGQPLGRVATSHAKASEYLLVRHESGRGSGGGFK